MTQPSFLSASPYKDDILALPVIDPGATSSWYCKHFGMVEVARHDEPHPTVVLERDGVRIGFAVNGCDAAQEGAAIRVSDIHAIKTQLEANGLDIGDTRVDERDGKRLNVFFVVAPDGLCFYFNEPVDG